MLRNFMSLAASQSPWNSLEIAKLIVSAITPIAVAILGIWLTRLAKKFEHLQWRNQRLIDKRIAIYDALAPRLNDLLCYFTFVGCWKDLTPGEVIAIKRDVDKQIYLAAPLFPRDFFDGCMAFIGLCFATYTGWGNDAHLKTKKERRKEAAGRAWEEKWDELFEENDAPDKKTIRAAYKTIMDIFSREIGLNA